MQRMLLADVLKMETPARERAQAACAWERLEERKRILRGKPLPGSYKPIKQQKKHTPLTYSEEPYSEVPAPLEQSELPEDLEGWEAV